MATTTTTSTTTTTTAAPTVNIRSLTVRMKRSAVPNKVPTVDDLELGELALNYHDGKLYAIRSNGVTQTVVHLNEGTTYTAGDGIEIDGTTINNSGVTHISGGDNISVTENTGEVVVSFDGVLDIAQGGTGQTTANNAFNALAPSQVGQDGKFLTTDGEDTGWTEFTATFLTDTLGFTPVNKAGDTMGGNLNFADTHRITNLPEPEASNEPATKNYVDNAITGLHWKPAVAAFADSNVNLSVGPWAIDGYTLVTNDRVLLTNQSTDTQNGIWKLNADSTFSRPTDADSFEKLNTAAVFVLHGDDYGDTGWVQVTTLTSFANQEWDQFTGGGSLSAGEGISIVGNVISNTGVQRLTAGEGLSVTTETGEVEVSLDGPIAITQGGTGHTTASEAINALLPTQSGKTGSLLTTDGTNVQWLTSTVLASANVYHVSKNGSDTTGDGTVLRPFATVGRALQGAGVATINDPIVIRIGSGRYIETGDIALRPWVFLVGEHHQDVRITADNFVLHEDFEGSDDLRSGAISLTINGPVNFDFAAVNSTAGKLFFESVNFNALYEVNANSTVNQIFVENGWMFSTVSITGGTHNFNSTYFFSDAFFGQGAVQNGSVSLLGCSMQEVFLTVQDFAKGNMNLYLLGSPIQVGLTVSGSHGIIYTTADSIPPKSVFSSTPSISFPAAKIIRLSDAYGTLYSPTTAQHWLDLGAPVYDIVGDLVFDVGSALDASVKYVPANTGYWTEVGQSSPATNKEAIDALAYENYLRWKNLRTVAHVSSNITLPTVIPSPPSSHNPDDSVSVVLADASASSIVITLPDAEEWEKKYYTIKKVDDTANLVTLQTVLGQTIDGDTTFILSAENAQITFISDGANWYELSSTASSGYTGSRGVPGYTGSQGAQGTAGERGYTGSQGVQGPPGPPEGYTGSKGDQGDRGYTGSQGPPGPPQGYTGSQGIQGPIGYTGYTGSQGIQGPIGPEGPQGPAGGYTGSRGETGYTGSQGEQGPAGGYTGSRGDIGYTGSRGVPGVDGISAGTTFKYEYRNLTSQPASLGEVNFNSLNLATASVIRLSYRDVRFVDNRDFFVNIANGNSAIRAYLVFTKESDPATFAIYSIDAAATDDTTNDNILFTITFISGSTSIVYSDSDPVLISFVRTGDKGDTGTTGYTGSMGYTGSRGSIGDSGVAGGSSFVHTYDNAVFSDAVAGVIRMSSQNMPDVTILRIPNVDYYSNDNEDFYAAISAITNPVKAYVNVMDRNDASLFTIFAITGHGYSGYYQFTVQYVSGRTSIPNGSLVNVSFSPSGNAGTVGYTGSSGATGATGYTGSQGAIGYTGSASAEITVESDTISTALYPVLVSNTGVQTPKVDTSDLSFNASTGRLFSKDLQLSGVLDIQEALEKVTVTGSGISGTVNFDGMTQSIVYYDGNATENWTLNVRGNSTTTLNTFMQNGQSLTLTLLVTQGSTGYAQTAMTIDGTAVTVKWLNSTPPTAGTANTITAYTFSIIKTAANTYTVFATTATFG